MQLRWWHALLVCVLCPFVTFAWVGLPLTSVSAPTYGMDAVCRVHSWSVTQCRDLPTISSVFDAACRGHAFRGDLVECCSFKVALFMQTGDGSLWTNTTISQPTWVTRCDAHYTASGLQQCLQASETSSRVFFPDAQALTNQGLPSTEVKLTGAVLPALYCKTTPCYVVTAVFCTGVASTLLILLVKLLICVVKACCRCCRARFANGHEQQLHYIGVSGEVDDNQWLETGSKPPTSPRKTTKQKKKLPKLSRRAPSTDSSGLVGEELMREEVSDDEDGECAGNVREMLTEYRMQEAMSQMGRAADI